MEIFPLNSAPPHPEYRHGMHFISKKYIFFKLKIISVADIAFSSHSQIFA